MMTVEPATEALRPPNGGGEAIGRGRARRKADAPDPMLEAVASGQTVSIAYRDGADLRSKRLSVAHRAGLAGFRVEFRHDATTLAIRRIPNSGIPDGTVRPFTTRIAPPVAQPTAPAPETLHAPDTLCRLADQMAREIAMEQDADTADAAAHDADAAAQRSARQAANAERKAPNANAWPQHRPPGFTRALDGVHEPVLVCYVARGARQCGQCQRWGLLHYSALTNASMVVGGSYRIGAQRHYLCPSCLSLTPHRLLF